MIIEQQQLNLSFGRGFFKIKNMSKLFKCVFFSIDDFKTINVNDNSTYY